MEGLAEQSPLESHVGFSLYGVWGGVTRCTHAPATGTVSVVVGRPVSFSSKFTAQPVSKQDLKTNIP